MSQCPSFPAGIPCQSILDSVADGVFTVDLAWRITSFNRAAEAITGVSRDEAVGRTCREVFHSSICDGACAMRACLQSGEPVVNKSIFIVRPDGRRVPISVSAAPLRGEDGRPVGGVETFRDLTALHLMRKELEEFRSLEDIHTRSKPLLAMLDILPQIAASGSPVLLLGESGTGKELFARALHNLSERKDGPFVAVNCGALPENLLESELFGYKAGAFTDARRDKPGRFHLAAGGTLFLDEVGDLPQALQVKILRVLQEKTFEPLGALAPEKANARVVAATNRDLASMVAAGSFRRDLYYRLNVVELELPPLRDRPEDIPLLVAHFVRRQSLISGKEIAGVSEDVMHILMRHDYQGNVRELQNILEYAFILCRRGFIQIEDLPERLKPQAAGAAAPTSMEEIKRRAAREAVARHNGRRMAACRELGITKDTLRRLLRGG
ncbi:putative sigma54 specific transcriptional regulator with PAS/PAC sensor [Desulfovibrio sp. X2]|uniref:sigma-54 interaction domain-containing protein n=1 Tax=Desulfovibrio sp. X2 TaxID=941449 RepID=UPI0003587DF5|nr:sigma 54-interacting transcriptional regulator [Desulfovibrio sp. X2]EPR41963.1 putative sigma54 specific transcriptional regulator with PAS/PAC sensor [Desulfovibrio sp. X2]